MVMLMNSVLGISTCLILVVILKNLHIIVILIKKVLGKMKDEFNGVKIDELIVKFKKRKIG